MKELALGLVVGLSLIGISLALGGPVGAIATAIILIKNSDKFV